MCLYSAAKIYLRFEPNPGAVKAVLPSQMQAVIMDGNLLSGNPFCTLHSHLCQYSKTHCCTIYFRLFLAHQSQCDLAGGIRYILHLQAIFCQLHGATVVRQSRHLPVCRGDVHGDGVQAAAYLHFCCPVLAAR